MFAANPANLKLPPTRLLDSEESLNYTRTEPSILDSSTLADLNEAGRRRALRVR